MWDFCPLQAPLIAGLQGQCYCDQATMQDELRMTLVGGGEKKGKKGKGPGKNATKSSVLT